MSELKSELAAMTATVQIKRAATGKVEEYTLTFTPVEQEEQKEASNGGDAQRDGS